MLSPGCTCCPLLATQHPCELGSMWTHTERFHCLPRLYHAEDQSQGWTPVDHCPPGAAAMELDTGCMLSPTRMPTTSHHLPQPAANSLLDSNWMHPVSRWQGLEWVTSELVPLPCLAISVAQHCDLFNASWPHDPHRETGTQLQKERPDAGNHSSGAWRGSGLGRIRRRNRF